MYAGNMSASGAFYTAGSSGSRSTGADSGNTGIWNFNASRSSSIYGNSNTVQPPAVQIRVKTRFK